MASVTLDGVHKTYPNGHIAARGLDLVVEEGEFVVLVGPSGCGKSTALRMVAGLESPTRGRVLIGERDVTDLPPQDRDIAMVFQSYALYPHMTVRENLAFGLRMRRTPKQEIASHVESAAAALGLEELLDRRPVQLSGGQRQRVALGRAIVREPKAFLFDEPLSNLDAKLRVETRAELARLHRRLGATMLYVTHDQEEAMTLGERVAVMRDGSFQQVAPPMEVYRRPANRFVAGFVGSPQMNFFPCELREGDGRRWLEGASFRIPLEDGARRTDAESTGSAAGAGLILGIRPHDIALVAPDRGDAHAQVDVVELLGAETLVHLRLEVPAERGGRVRLRGDGDGQVRAVVPPEDAAAGAGDLVGLQFRRDRLHLFDTESGRRIE